MKYRVFGGILVSLGFAFLFSCAPAKATSTAISTQDNTSIRGVVLDEEEHPLANAIVRIKATEHFVTTASDGSFELTGLPAGQPVSITAFLLGYYIGGGEKILPGTTDAEIVLKKHINEDNENYEWLSAFSDAGEEGNCQNCHHGLDAVEGSLPFAEWKADAHALSTQNIRFLTMYLGQDVNGNQSPLREYGVSRDYGRIPMRPDPDQPYYGPGYKLDFPETAGNCSSCHAPAAAINAAYETDPTQVSGVGAEGVACDFCHKVWSVNLDPSTGLPQSNMPGVLSFEFRRPPEGHQFFAGPLDDVAPGEDTYVPIQTQSQFCAPCHFQSFWGTQVYNSFGEWLESPYSNSETGKTCQDCHMPAGKNNHFARLDKGASIRDSQTIFSHLMPGASDVELLQNAVTMTAEAKIENDRLVVEVKITNDQTGHHVPTDSPLRQMILLVDATDEIGQALSLLEGETIPAWGGVGDPSLGYYASLPGKGYAKILMEMWTEIEPTGSYWNPTQIVSDNRIAAFESDVSTYVFTAPDKGEARVKITLLFRRAFKELMDQKGWDVPDITMEEESLHVNPQ
jgi:Carboxypeptidase regulatory-like domain